jgi:peptidoglycan/xylan/chitin deacetylase (PgdA/CDA1 family)
MLKKGLHSLFLHTAAQLPFSYWQHWSKERLFLPFYHLVSDENPAHIRHLYPVRTIRQFRADLDFLLKHFQAVDLGDIYTHVLDNQAFNRPVFHLTFDDGLRECYDVIMPVLLEKGVPATFFLNSAFVDNRDLMFRYKASLLAAAGRPEALRIGYAERHILDLWANDEHLDFDAFLREQRPYLSTPQIRTMQSQGFHIGAHSIDHPLFRDLPLIEQVRQVSESMDFVQAHFAPKWPVFAFPFTDDGVGLALFAALNPSSPAQSEMGRDRVVSFGGAGLKSDVAPRHLQRFAMERTAANARHMVSAEFAYTILRKYLGKHQVRRR